MKDEGAKPPLYTGRLQRFFTAGVRSARCAKGLGSTNIAMMKQLVDPEGYSEAESRAYLKGVLAELIHGYSSTRSAGFYLKPEVV